MHWAPCLDEEQINALQTGILCGAANNILVNPDTDARLLAQRDVLYGTDFVVNAGGVIHLAGLCLGYIESDLQKRNDAIEGTTAQILSDAAGGSTYEAAIDMAKSRIESGNPLQESCHAG